MDGGPYGNARPGALWGDTPDDDESGTMMMAKTDLTKLKALTDCYGADTRRWPRDSHTDASPLGVPLARIMLNAQAQQALDEARELDTWLSALPEPEIPQYRVDAVVAAALRTVAAVERRRTPRSFLHGWLDTTLTALRDLSFNGRIGWLAGATAAGLLLGVVTLPQSQATLTAGTTASPDTMDAASLLFTSYTVETPAR